MKLVSSIATVVATLAGLQLTATPHAEAQTTPSFPPAVITGFRTSGVGCPQKNVTITDQGSAPGGQNTASTDALGHQWIVLSLPDYSAYVGEGDSFGNSQCNIEIDLDFKGGARTYVNTVKFVGWKSLEPGVTGQLDATYRWTNQPIQSQSNTPHRWTGPINEPLAVTDVVSGKQLSACRSRETFEVRSVLSLRNTTNPARNGEISVNQVQVDQGSGVKPLSPLSVLIEVVREPCNRAI